MLALRSKPNSGPDGVSRRDFLRFGGLGVLGLSAAEQRAQAEASGKGRRACILVQLNGGPSQFETFDPKPAARGDIRGPYRAIATATTGLQFSETLPQLAQRSDRLVVLRSLCHDAAPLHETGLQLLQTGRLVRGEFVPPSLGSIVSRLLGSRNDWPAYAVLPRPLGDGGSSIWQGQWAGSLGGEFDPWSMQSLPELSVAVDRVLPAVDEGASVLAPPTLQQTLVRKWLEEADGERRSYGDTDLGRSCLAARRMVEQGVRFVTINMFETLAGRITWDCHAHPVWAPACLSDYRNALCPELDRALTALLDDLEQRGLLSETLVVVSGEFGRSPRISEGGGRDHWTGVWSALMAGGGLAGGQVIGASDPRGACPAERPIAPAELAATILQCLGVDLTTQLTLPQGGEIPLADAQPIAELFG
ncbi:MAG: DUF1501 domain-containing protein [Planctomycetales bacterium]